MSRRAARFTEADVSRALKALKKAGCTIAGVEGGVDGFRILTTEGAGLTHDEDDDKALDRMLAEHAKAHGYG